MSKISPNTVVPPFVADEATSTMRPRKVYVAGPMRGLPLFNFPAFEHATKVLRARGFEVTSPAEEDIKKDGLDVCTHGDVNTPPHTFAHYMERDLAIVCRMDAVAVLPGWVKSQGACLEVYVARAIGLIIFDADTGKVLPDPEHITHHLQPLRNIEKYIGDSPVLCGIGGAPMRASTLPVDGKERKEYPIASGLLDYFPDACAAVAHVSYVGNEQHNPGKPLHWDRSKSGDEADTMQRHFLQRGARDKDAIRHSAKMAWRALALLQKEIESEAK